MARPIPWETIPIIHLDRALERYVEHGIMPGHFLTAVLSGDLMDAVRRAGSEDDVRVIGPLARWIAQHFPIGSYGTPDIVLHWAQTRGMSGMDRRNGR